MAVLEELECNESSSSQPTVFVGKECSLFRAVVALALWLGSIHFIVVLVFSAVFLFPSRFAYLVFALLLFLMVLPLNDESEFGQKLSRYICKYSSGYFPTTLHVEDFKAFDPKRAYVFGYEPHSVLPIGVYALGSHMGFMPLPKIKVLASSAVFYTPFLRQIWTWLGLIPASRNNFYSYLSAGYSCVIVPGGVQETLHMDHESEVIFLKKRKGFIRIAMEKGHPLVPVFCFGQSYVYKWWKPDGALFVTIARAIKFSPILFWGIFGSPIPYPQPMHIIVGKPIELQRNPSPTTQEVDDVHSQFISDLQDLFEKYKDIAGYSDLQLRIM
ncbi:Diacylglycerol acyltransferase 2 [Zostera marina]|uniref:Acyltransferase n=1 Tax=Zostera marina TaxID=29655 RepID=A0A0K9P0D3_ZOSMR|nr:Diacylglycerol acyltransferase 2 [Zostera marina]